MNKSVVIVGASGHGKVVADIVLKNKDNIVGFLDDNTELEESFAGFPVLGTTDQYQKYSDACFVIAIGNAAVVLILLGMEFLALIVTLYFVKKITGSLGKRDTEVRKWVCEKRYNGRNQKERI